MTSPDLQKMVHSVPLDFPFYLSCPIDSHHAAYAWEHESQTSACQKTGSICLHLIPAVRDDSYGNYRCVSQERDYTRVVKEYRLLKQQPPLTTSLFPVLRADAAKITAHLMAHLTSVLSIVLMVVLR